MERINAVFIEGERDWKEHLVAVFGDEIAGRLLSILGKEV